jgi:hypothetical protein
MQMFFEGALILVALGAEVNKSLKIDEQTIKKNVKAFTRTADAEYKLEQSQKNLYEKLVINAKRKNAILTCHIRMFQEQYSVIRKIQFKKGKGIEELERIDDIQKQLAKNIELPAISSGEVMKDSQLIITFALKGIGGLMIQDSKMNLQLATRNLTKANTVSAQADSMCIALDGIAQHVEIVTGLLENLGMLYIRSIKNLERILQINDLDVSKYSDKDFEAINVSLDLTKLVYRIINTPLIDEYGKIEQESVKIIKEGHDLIATISKGE